MRGIKRPGYGTLLQNFCRILLLLVVVLFLLDPVFSAYKSTSLLLEIACFAFLVCVQPFLSNSYRIPALIMLGLSLILALLFRLPPRVYTTGVSSMLNLVVLLVVMQLFTVPITIGAYGQSMGFLLRHRIRRERTLFCAVQIITVLFTCFLNLGTVPVMLALLKDSVSDTVSDYKQFASKAITRGYVCAVLWVPSGITVLMISGITGLKWGQFFPYCLLLSLIGLTLSIMLEYCGSKRYYPLELGRFPTATPKQLQEAKRKLTHVVLVVLCIVGGIALCERYLIVSSTHCIVVAGLAVMVIWLCLLLLKSEYRDKAQSAFKSYWTTGIACGFDMGALFICMGLFTEALKASPLMNIFSGLAQWASAGFLMLALLPLFIIVLSVIGIHPFISVTLVGNLLVPLIPTAEMLPMALALMFGSSAAYIVSPLAGVTLATSKFLNCSVRNVSAYWNGLYVICFYVLSTVVIGIVWYFL